MKNKKYKAAVIGCGNIGASIKNYAKIVRPGSHAEAFYLDKEIALVALVEKEKNRWPELKKNYPNVPIFENPENMYKEIKPDIVSIATQTENHHEQVLKAAKNKCPIILCEKPISYDLKQTREMVNVCRKNGCLLFVNHMRRFDPLIQKWTGEIKKGKIGDIYQAYGFYYNGLFNNGTHLLDLLRSFLGDPIWVFASYNEKTTSNQNDKNIDAVICFGDTIFSLHSLSKNYGHFGFVLLGEKGMVEFTNLCFEINLRPKIKNPNFRGFFTLANKIKKEGRPRSFMKSMPRHLAGVLDKRVKPTSTGDDGLAVLKLLAAIKKSADQNGKIVYL